MKKSNLFKLLALLVMASMVLAACGGGGDATEAVDSGEKVASSGFVCPEPSPRVELTSTQLNLFVWTEYFPPDMLECFELVYGITVSYTHLTLPTSDLV